MAIGVQVQAGLRHLRVRGALGAGASLCWNTHRVARRFGQRKRFCHKSSLGPRGPTSPAWPKNPPRSAESASIGGWTPRGGAAVLQRAISMQWHTWRALQCEAMAARAPTLLASVLACCSALLCIPACLACCG
eukprot:4607430-Alexandrium_andersonii.AAC.1